MTIIVGLIDGDRVVMGADTMCTSHSAMNRMESKLIERGAWLFGAANSVFINQFLRTATLPDNVTTEAVYDLSERWWSWCRAHDRIEDGILPGAALVASDTGRLWRLQPDGSVFEIPDFALMGAGEDIALGAMAALKDFSEAGLFKDSLHAEAIVTSAVKVAVRHHPFCGGRAEVICWPRQE